jgi:hypothetical protein
MATSFAKTNRFRLQNVYTINPSQKFHSSIILPLSFYYVKLKNKSKKSQGISIYNNRSKKVMTDWNNSENNW